MFEIRELEWFEGENQDLICRLPFSRGKAVISLKSGYLYLTNYDNCRVKKIECNSIFEAKQKANSHWRGILKEFLREVKSE